MIEVKNLSKEFKIYKKETGFMGSIKGLFNKKSQIVSAVDDISFNIAEGEIIGYIGPNGAGKSTSIKIMTGILTPTSGMCKINGKIPYKERKSYTKDIGVVFGQRTQLWWDLPLEESFLILKEIYEIDDETYEERKKFLDNVLEFSKFISSPVRTLSLGQRMRADLAASLLHNPKILFLDEPTIGLDVVVKENIRTAIKEINEKYKTTIILTTHDFDDIEDLCERIIMIDKGKKVYDGSIKKIKQKYGETKKIQVDVKHAESLEKLDFYKEFNLTKDDLKMTIDKNSLVVEFNRQKTSVSDIASYILKNTEIHDINIYETDIEEIIRKIYKNEVEVN